MSTMSNDTADYLSQTVKPKEGQGLEFVLLRYNNDKLRRIQIGDTSHKLTDADYFEPITLIPISVKKRASILIKRAVNNELRGVIGFKSLNIRIAERRDFDEHFVMKTRNILGYFSWRELYYVILDLVNVTSDENVINELTRIARTIESLLSNESLHTQGYYLDVIRVDNIY